MVLKGSDIQRYKVCPSGNYIRFEPESFQQVAPIEIYRAKEKLLYRFISEVPVFTYDNKQAFFSESLAKELHFDEIDSKYVEQSKTMITVFATITAFENATREFVFSTLAGAYGDDWWAKGVQNGIREKAQSRKDSETKVKWHINRGDMMMSYLEFGDLPKIMCSQGNWPYFEPYFGFSNAQEWIRTTFETIEKSRNVIMHSGVLDELDVARVGMNIIDWLHQINA